MRSVETGTGFAWRSPFVVACAVLLLLVVSCGDDDDDGAGGGVLRPAQGVDEITRQVIKEGQPESAQGELLELTRVIIPAGMEIAPHTHPGMQQAVIAEGTLTYTVIDGEVVVTHDSGTDGATTETITSGGTVELRPGSAVLEMPGMVHSARNDGDVAVVVYLASLFPVGAPASSPAE
jgi:quercetin dioxygenase-like cupin family protein